MESSAAPAGSAANPLLALLRDETAVAPPVATSEPPPPPPPVDEFEALSVAPAFKQALREARVEAATGATLVAVGCSQLASLAEMSEEDVQSLALPAEEEAKVLALTAGYRCGRAEGAAAATAAAAAQRPHSMFASPVSAAAAGSGSMFGSMASPPLGAAGMTSGGPPLTDANRPANAYGPNAIAITSTSIWDLFKRVGDHMGPGVFDLQGQTLTQDHAPSGRPHVFELTKHSVTLCNGTLVLTARQRVLLKGCRNVCFEDVTFATPPTQQPHGGDGGLLSQFGAMATLGGGFLAAGATNGRVMGSTAAAAAGAARPGTGAAVVAGGADGRPEETFPMLEAAAGAEVKFARCAFVCHDPSYSYCIKVAGAEQMQGTSKPTDVALSSCRLESSSDDVILAYVNNGAKLKADDTPMTGGDSVMVARGGADVVLDGCELSKARGPAAAKLAAGLGSPAGSFTAGAARGERPPLVGWVFNGDGLLASGAGTKVTATRCKFRENVSWGVEVHKGAAVELKHCHVVENRSRLQGMTGGVYVWGEGASATTGAGCVVDALVKVDAGGSHDSKAALTMVERPSLASTLALASPGAMAAIGQPGISRTGERTSVSAPPGRLSALVQKTWHNPGPGKHKGGNVV